VGHFFCFYFFFQPKVYAGLGPDYRVLVKSARKSAQKYYQTYHEVEPVPMLVRDTANICQEYTQSGGKFVVFSDTS
jgi:20S proteasome alpha/beta subunit